MNHDVGVIQQDPVTVPGPLAMERLLANLAEFVLDVVDNGAQLTLVASRANDEYIG